MLRKSINFPQSLRKTSLALAIAATLALPVSVLAAPGDRVGGEFRVNTTTIQSQRNSAVAMDADGDFVVVWDTISFELERYSDINAQRYNSAGVKQGPEFQVNTNSANSGQFDSDVAIDSDGDFVVTWTSYDSVNPSTIRAQRFNKLGVKQGSEFQVNTPRADNAEAFQSAVALEANGDFVVTWTRSNPNGSPSRLVVARRFNNTGVAQGGEFLIDTADTSDSQSDSDVAIDADGDFVVTWKRQTFDNFGGAYEIFAQRYNNAGVTQGGPFLVNTTIEDGTDPTIAMDSDGDFVIAWTAGVGSNPQYPGFGGYNIFAQRFNSVGVRQGAEIPVSPINEPTNSSLAENESSVAMDADGDFVVAWTKITSSRPTSPYSSYYDRDVFAKRYNKTGAQQGEMFRVNTTTAKQQLIPDVALDADGDFVVTWESSDQDGDRYGIFAQRYAGAGVSTGVTCNGLAATLVGTSGNDNLIGTSGDDVIAGLGGNDILIGLNGNDTLCGNSGVDRLLGGLGNDILIGGADSDTAVFGGSAGVFVDLSTGIARGEGNDTLREIGNVTGTGAADNITGNGQQNLLIGGQGNDILNGLGGDDFLLGGSANDTLNGGAGTDICNGQDGSADTASSCETVQNVP
jgi:Ca2+-binding RTX toxin-like protein